MRSTKQTAWCALWLLILVPAIAGAAPGRRQSAPTRRWSGRTPSPTPTRFRRRPDLPLLPVRRLHGHAGGQGMDGRRTRERLPSRHGVSGNRGKIWSAVEKSTGRSFIYDNQVVKFATSRCGAVDERRHRAELRHHRPHAQLRHARGLRDEHGRFRRAVVVGVLDLLTRTPWRLEVTLPSDAAYFTTRSIWHNATPIEQPYYTWMNTGIKAAGNLELIYPGTHHIGHGGEVAPWPVERLRAETSRSTSRTTSGLTSRTTSSDATRLLRRVLARR